MRIHWTIPVFLLAAPMGRAQGADDCASAQTVTGLGTFAFDNTAATTDGAMDCGTGSLPVRRDVWFRWTAPSTGAFGVSTCGQTSLVTRIAIYEGTTCPPPSTPLECEADNCGGQTVVYFLATAGQDYLIRLGSKQVGAFGSGTFTINDGPCPGATDDSLEPNDDCISAIGLVDGTYTALHVDKARPDWFKFVVADGATLNVQINFVHANGDLDVRMWDACGGNLLASSTSGSNNETINWTNNTGCDVTGVMEIEHWLSDQNADCNDYDVIVTGEGPGTCGGPGTVDCTPGNANSTGVPGSIAAAGSAVAAANDLTLTASDLPANQLGYFIGGTGNTAFTPPGAAGPFCLGGAPLSRFLTGPTTTSAGGTLTLGPADRVPLRAGRCTGVLGQGGERALGHRVTQHRLVAEAGPGAAAQFGGDQRRDPRGHRRVTRRTHRRSRVAP